MTDASCWVNEERCVVGVGWAQNSATPPSKSGAQSIYRSKKVLRELEIEVTDFIALPFRFIGFSIEPFVDSTITSISVKQA